MRPAEVVVVAAHRVATLLLALILLATALVLPAVPARAAPPETFADDFQSADFSGSTGSQPWTGPWIETGESDGVGAGIIQVDNEGRCYDDVCLVLGKDNSGSASVEREADLSAFATATLEFQYDVHRHALGLGSASLSVSANGGTDWTPLETWLLGVDADNQFGSYDITDYVGPDTMVRFSVSTSFDDSHLNVDNLVITGNGRAGYYDEFTSTAWDGSDGSLDWSPDPWIETEGDGVVAGFVQVIANGFCESGNCLRLEGDGVTKDHSAVRQVDLSTATSATLSYNYRRENYASCSTRVEVSGNGGTDWDPLVTHGSNGGDSSQQSASFDLSGYLVANAQIRFISEAYCAPGEFFHADNVWIQTDMTPPPQPPPDVVISEVSHRGDDFIELYNIGPSPVDIDGYRIRLDGSGTSHITVNQGGGPVMVPVGGHYLLAEAGGGLAGTADQTFGFGLPGDFGIRLRDDVGQLLDEVGVGTSSWFEGSAIPSMPGGTTQSYERRFGVSLGNCVDTDDNVADFVHNWGTTNPQNSTDPPVACGTPGAVGHVVISEFRPEGPGGDLDEFVELFNPTAVAVDISGWIVHITEPGLFRDYHVIPGGTILDPDERYLLSNVDGPIPADAQPYDIATNYSAAWGDVVLKDNVGAIVDVLGYGDTGNGQLFEGTALPAYDGGTNDRSFERRNGGYTDTDNNISDFVYAFVATPERGIPGPNRAPVFDQDLLDRSDTEGDFIAISSPATDPDWGDTLTYSATGLPEGISIDPTTGDITGAFGPNSSGVHAITITVTDDGSPILQDTDGFTWTVATGEVTYLVANSGGGNGGDDLLSVVDRADANPVTNEVNIGTGTSTWNIEAAALQPGTNILFAVENDQLGTINVTTGVFAPKPTIAGAGNGSVGLVAFDNVEGLSFNPFTAELFGTHRRGDYEEDLLFKLDPSTGAHVPGAFGGDDYITIENQGPYWHATDIAFDPTSGQLYLIHWTFLNQWSIATLDPATGATSTVGPAPADLVGLAFDENGRLYATTDNGLETLYELNKTNASQISAITIDNASDYEAMAIAFPADANTAPAFDQDLLDRSDVEGTPISLSAAATDADAGDNLSYSATGLPPGLGIHPGTGLVTGTIGFAATGDYPVEILVTDDGIPNLGASDTFTWTVTEANQPPSFDQDPLDRNDAEGSVISLSAAATDPDVGDTLTYGATGLPSGLSIDTGSGLITGTIDYTAAAGSPHAVIITVADDGSPSESATPDSLSWTVSNTNLPPTIVSPGAQTTPELAPFSITVSAGDPDGQIPSFTDGASLPAWAVLTDNLDGTATIAGTPGAGDSGTTTVTITAADGGVPNLSDDGVFDITVTNTNLPPTITNPGNQPGAEASPFSLLLTASDPDGTTVSFSDGSTLPAWATLTDNGDNTATIAGTPGYTDAATSTVTITVSDGSLTDDAVFDITVTNANRPPVANAVADQTVAEGDPLTPLTVTASDPDGTTPSLAATGLPGWATFLDNGDGTATITGTAGYTDAATSTVTINVEDGGVPNLTDTTTFDLTVTNTNRPPVANPVADQTVAEGDPLTPLTVTASDPDGTTPSLAATGLPGWATFTDNGDGTATITGTPTYTDAATSTVTINVEDGGVPNLADTTTFNITVTNTNLAPTMVNPGNQTVAENDPFNLVVTASDPDATTPIITETGLPGWASFTDNGDGTATITGTPSYTDAATTTVTITASDGSFTDDAVFDLTVTNTNRPPVANPVADQTVAEGTPLTPLIVTSSDPDGTTATITQTGLPGWANFVDNGDGTATITGTPSYTDAATTTVTIIASDGSLTDDAVFDLTVTNVNRPPTVSPVTDHSVAEGSALTPLVVTASDPDGTFPSLAATGLPGWASFVDNGDGTATITGTPGYDDAGVSTVTVTASDGDLIDTTVFDLTVTDTNRAPLFATDIADRVDAEGATVSLSANATDPDLDGLVYTASGLPPGLAIDAGSGLITGSMSYGSAGIYPVEITVTDDGDPSRSAVDTFTWTITNTNRPPVLSVIGDQIGPEQTPISFTAVATDPDSDGISFSLAGEPTGSSIDPVSGVFTWTPTEADGIGSHTVTVTVHDDGSPALADSQIVTITVTETNRAPSIEAIADQSDTEGDTINLEVSASDPDLPKNTLGYSATGLPGGLTINPDTGAITGTVAMDAAGHYSVAVSVTDDASSPLLTTEKFAWTIADTNRPPVLNAIASQGGAEKTVISFTATATDPDSDQFTFALSGEPSGATIDPVRGVFSWTPDEGQGPGSYSIAVTVTDAGKPALSDTREVSVTVTETNEPPTIIPPGDQLSGIGAVVNISTSADDPDLPSNTLTYAATGLPTGLAINPATGSINGTIAADTAGSHPVSITVTDDGSPRLSATATLTWEVADDVEAVAPNLPPSLTPTGDQFTSEGNTVSLAIEATDENRLTYAASGLPPGLTINKATGLITGMAETDIAGLHQVTLTVTDDGTPAMHAIDTFAWIITNPVAAGEKEDLVQALDSFENTPVAETEQPQPIRRSLVVMGSAAAATTEALSWPLGLLLALLMGFATIGRVGLYPLLWRGDRHSGTISFYDPEINFGLIDPDSGGEAVFVHANAFPRRQRSILDVGARIRYRVLASDNRASAWGAKLESEHE